MRILALETTEKTGGVAALEDGNVLKELQLEPTQRSAQSLAPAIRDLLAAVGWQPADVNLVGVISGPGSFTGLRVGITTAKTFAYAIGAEVLSVSALEVIAAAVPGDVGQVTTVMDALRGDIVVQTFERQSEGWRPPIGLEELVSAAEWLGRLQQGDVVSGPGLAKLMDRLPIGVKPLDRHFWPPKAAIVGQLAYRYYSGGRRDDLWTLVPHYCRPSAAEEKLRAKSLNPGRV